MFVGGCAGSTGGAIKCIRIYVLIKEAARELYRLVHPHAVASNWILTACMLFGRLEIYTILVLLLPEFWKK